MIINVYSTNDFIFMNTINKKTNYSQIYIGEHTVTRKRFILKKFIHSSKYNIIEHISKEFIMNKYLTQYTDISIKMDGICFGKTEDDIEIFMVLEEGDFSLYQYLYEVNYNMNDIKKIFYEILKLIFILHSHGIIHNDIKVENLMFQNKKIKIIDFGLSDFLLCSPDMDIVMNYSCTEYTKAPDKRKSYESDVYSLGLTIIHLITKSYLKPQIIFNDNMSFIVIIQNKIYNSEYFISQIGIDGYDLLKQMLNKNMHKRISISGALLHPYFKSFGKFNYNITLPNINNSLKLSHTVQIKNVLPINLFTNNINYSKDEYFLNKYELIYKELHMKKIKNIKIKLNKKLNIDFNKYLSNKYICFDSFINALILFREYDLENKLEQKYYHIYFCMFCIIYNSIFTFDKGLISYHTFIQRICKVHSDDFIEIYMECLKIILNTQNIYFVSSIMSYYLYKIVLEYEIIDENYIMQFKLKCAENILELIKSIKIEEIEIDKIIILQIFYIFQ